MWGEVPSQLAAREDWVALMGAFWKLEAPSVGEAAVFVVVGVLEVVWLIETGHCELAAAVVVAAASGVVLTDGVDVGAVHD